MTCEAVKDKLGLYVDAELDADELANVERHLASCPGCAGAAEDFQTMADALQPDRPVEVPDALWHSIEASLAGAPSDLDRAPSAQRRATILRGPVRAWALAAAVALAVGLGLWGISQSGSRAKAAPIDFSMLFETLELDPRQAFQKFLDTYQAKPGSRSQAKRYARRLNFELPESLPGGFQLDEVYLVNFGGSPGVAASYFRGEEFLAAIFHTPVHEESYGTHEDYDCVVGKHRGHKVSVGEWKLVHLTDATTCRCVLSRLDENRELPPILSAIAPNLDSTQSPHPHP